MGVILLLIVLPLVFFQIGGYYRWLLGYTYLFIIQAYVAWFLFFKVGQSFFAYATLLGISGYVTALLLDQYHWPIWLAMPLAICLTSIIAVVMYAVTSRQKGFYMGLTSFLMVVLFQKVASASPTLGKSWGINIGKLAEFNIIYIVTVITTVISIGILFYVMRTDIGKIFVLIGENEELAKAVGLYTVRYKILAYLVGGIISGLGGALYVSYIGIITPEDVSMLVTMKIFFMPMIGGSSFLYGPIIGAFIIVWLVELFKLLEYYLPILIGISYILVIVFAREGVGYYFNKFLEALGKRA